MTTCSECGHFYDDNPGKALCRTCEDWIVTASAELEPTEE